MYLTNVSYKKDPSQRKACGCIVSRDISGYNTCLLCCQHCYASTSFEKAKVCTRTIIWDRLYSKLWWLTLPSLQQRPSFNQDSIPCRTCHNSINKCPVSCNFCYFYVQAQQEKEHEPQTCPHQPEHHHT